MPGVDAEVIALGKELTDKRPSAGQAWGLGGGDADSEPSLPRTSLLALKAKGERHAVYVSFLRRFGLWESLSVGSRRQLAEQGEKLAACMQLASSSESEWWSPTVCCCVALWPRAVVR